MWKASFLMDPLLAIHVFFLKYLGMMEASTTSSCNNQKHGHDTRRASIFLICPKKKRFVSVILRLNLFCPLPLLNASEFKIPSLIATFFP